MVSVPDVMSNILDTTPGLVGSIAVAFLMVATLLGYIGYRFHLQNKLSSDTPYPAYGVVGPGVTTKIDIKGSGHKTGSNEKSGAKVTNGKVVVNGDRKLAESAEMFHYQSQKQQISGTTGHPATRRLPSGSDSEDDGEENGYVVYECPGLAPPGEMEVKNPLFQDDSCINTPNTPSSVPSPKK